MACFNITPLQLSDTFNTWFTKTNTIISTINDIEIAGISVYSHPTDNYFGQIIERVNNSCYLTSQIITGPFINFIDGSDVIYGAGTSADPRKITLTFPNDPSFLANRQLTGNDELIINDGSVEGGIPVKRIKANDLVPSVIDVSYLRIQNRTDQTQGATFSFYANGDPINTWSGISASSFSAERVGGYLPSTEPVGSGSNHKPVIPVTNGYGLIPDSFVRLPLSFRLDDTLVPGFDATADTKSFNLSAGRGISMTGTTGTDPQSGLVNAISYEIEALIPATGNSGSYGMNLFNINGYNTVAQALTADGRSLLSAHAGLSGGKGIKTSIVTRDVSTGVNYVIPGDPNTVINYSGINAIDIFTIAENPDDSDYVRKIGDVMTGTLTGTSTNFVFGNGRVVNGFTADIIDNTTLFTGKNVKTENGYAIFKIASGSTFSVLDSANTSVLEITPTTDTISLNNGDHEFATGNVSLSGVLQLDYTSVQSGKTLFVNGESKLEGNVEIYEGLVVDGGITAVNGDVFIQGNVSITGSCLIEGFIETDGASFDNLIVDTITGKFADFSQAGDNTGIKTYSSNIGENVLLANGSTGFVAIGLNENFVDNQNKKLTVSGGMSADYAFINSLIANDTETVGLTADLGNFNIIKTNRARREGNFYIYEQNDSVNQSVLQQILITDGPTFTSFESGSEYITKKYLDAILPVGTIIPYAGAVTNSTGTLPNNTNPPRGWHLCDGSLKDVFINGQPTVWANLYNVIGTTYGNVGSRFRLPDLRGRVIRGGGTQGYSNPSTQTGQFAFPTTMGVYGGSERIALTTGQMPRHRHAFLRLSTGRDGDNNANAKGIIAPENTYSESPNNYNVDRHVMNWEGNNEAHDNMQPYYNINYLIKYL